MKHRHTALRLVVLVLALAAFTSPAFAGGGNGNGGGNDHGNSANAPGQADKQSSTSASNPATGGDNSNGVKPSNSTKHDTYAKASSDKTKKYGNGKTAGQIATQAGYGDATLHGPGNSQPHKTAACPGGHEVDVHALKHKKGKCGAAEAAKPEAAKPEVQHAAEVQKPEEHTQSQALGVSESAHQHVTICHATGSASNPFVRISPSASGVFHGHMGHQDARDIIPPFTFKGQSFAQNWDEKGMAIWNNGCAIPAPPAAAAPAAVAPAAVVAPASVATPAAPAPATQSATAGESATLTPAGNATATPAPVGGVKGAVVTLKPTKTKPAGGVLGTTTRLGGAVAGTNLPFTGLPLWIFALAAASLIAIGATVRRSASQRN